MAPAVVFAVVAVAAFLFRAPPPDRVVLLPGPDGQTGAVVLTAGSEERVLDTPYAAAEVRARGGIAPAQSDAVAVEARYRDTLTAMPPAPLSYIVYFASGSATELAPASADTLTTLKSVLPQRPAPEVIVIGHTDRVGKLEENDALSLERAKTVAAILVAAGVPAERIEVAGRGEREPLVATDDDVAEPANRRVQIVVR